MYPARNPGAFPPVWWCVGSRTSTPRLRTRISHPPNRQTYGPSLWAHILRDQVHVDEDEFWACVREKKVPQRGRGEPTQPSIPAGVVAQLLSNGVEESEVRLMSRAEAIERLNLIWSQEA
jgi:hypothetical protein